MQRQKHWIPPKETDEKLLVAVLSRMVQNVLLQEGSGQEETETKSPTLEELLEPELTGNSETDASQEAVKE